MTLLIGKNSVVSMHYKLSDDDGNILDSSEGSEPLIYLQGSGTIITGLEKALVGKIEGDSLQVRVEPSEGYGETIPDLIHTVEKEAFQGVETIEVGMSFEAQGPDAAVQRVTVQQVEGDKVTINANHPLAGVVLNFDVEIISIRDATEEEVEHGHVH